MVKLLFFHFRVTKSSLKNKKKLLQVTNSMDVLLFSHFQVTNVNLINEKSSLIITVSK